MSNEIVVDVSSLVALIDKLIAELRARKAKFSVKDAATSVDQQREYITGTLKSLIEFIETITPNEGLEQPLVSLAGSLISLHKGGEMPPIFAAAKPASRGRPQRTMIRRKSEVLCAACVDVLMAASQLSEERAAKFVAGELNHLGFSFGSTGNRSAPNWKSVLEWRRRLREQTDEGSKSDRESYHKLARIRPPDAQSAVKKTLRAMAQDHLPPAYIFASDTPKKGK